MAQNAKYEDEFEAEIPCWLPEAARHYLEHIEAGKSIRAIAREANVHPSTILRQIRKVEHSRDDPVVDGALRRLSGGGEVAARRGDQAARRRTTAAAAADLAQEAYAAAEMWRVLGRMTEAHVSLVIAKGLEKGLLVREGQGQDPIRLGVVPQEVIGRLALRSWIVTSDPEAKVVHYRLSPTGRGALRARRIGQSEAALEEEGRYIRPAENPMLALSRRKAPDGNAYLPRDLQRVAEFLREDYELSRLDLGGQVPPLVQDAKLRLDTAKAALGPGLSDVAIAVCCEMAGLEGVERKMGWSARSGKVVLKIALERLQAHYAALQGSYGPRIS